VNDADVGLLAAHFASDLAGAVHRVDEHVVGGEAGRLVAERHHLAAHRIDLRMRRERFAFPRTVVVVGTDGIERRGIDLVRQPVFLQREELSAVSDGRGVGDGAQVRTLRIAHRLVVGERVAVVTVELPLGGDDLLVAMRPDPAALVAHGAVAEAERADVPVRVEHGVVRELRRIQPLAAHAHEGAVQVLRNLPDHLAIGDVRLETHRRKEADLRGISRIARHPRPPARFAGARKRRGSGFNPRPARGSNERGIRSTCENRRLPSHHGRASGARWKGTCAREGIPGRISRACETLCLTGQDA
jgi:hypothetical protein